MRTPILLLPLYLSLATWGVAAEFVVTPGGERVEVENVIRATFPYNGGVVIKFKVYTGHDGKWVLHGTHTRSYRSGDMVTLTTYAHGVKQGRFAKWYPNNRIEVEGAYGGGLLDGVITWYYPSGRIQKSETYARGELNGPFSTFFEEGGILEEGTCVYGLREGAFVEYHANGAKSYTGIYRRGYFDGTLTAYGLDGAKLAEGLVADDRVVGSWNCFTPDGRPARVRDDCAGKVYIECSCR